MKNLLGQVLKELRQQNSLTQREFAKEFGVSHAAVANWENSRREPSLDTLIRLAKFFDVTVDFLLGTES
ncbi:MAG: helix-turn-helix domain-containing protein [Firmicutes bacterium]|nr:helix-turn-helix domain-containing protein [Bacillota bacterium]